jgi:preprotein translocase subunit SecG
MNIFQIVLVVSATIMILLILVQTRGAGLGAGLSGSGGGELHTQRRGVEKNIFQLTIISAVVFVSSIILSILLG